VANPAEAAAKVFLETYRQAAEARLATVLADKRAQLSQRPFGAALYFDHLAEYVQRGGKRLRGALVVLGHAAASENISVDRLSPSAVEASLSLELLHAYLLAYDDFMDRDEQRRGGPSLHLLTRDEAARRGAADPAHRGISVTLLLGMLAQSLAFDCLRRSGASTSVRDYFDVVSEGVTVGQLLDVIAVDAPDATLADISVIHQLKTGLYTTEGPLVLGALLAGASQDSCIVQALQGWARPLGEAFQLVDDILGAVGDAEETGKPACGDLREGKRSAVLEEALALSVGPAGARLRSLAGRPLDAAQAEEARGLIVASGAVDRVRDRARALAAQARAALGSAPIAFHTLTLFDGLAGLIVERSR